MGGQLKCANPFRSMNQAAIKPTMFILMMSLQYFRWKRRFRNARTTIVYMWLRSTTSGASLSLLCALNQSVYRQFNSINWSISIAYDLNVPKRLVLRLPTCSTEITITILNHYAQIVYNYWASMATIINFWMSGQAVCSRCPVCSLNLLWCFRVVMPPLLRGYLILSMVQPDSSAQIIC